MKHIFCLINMSFTSFTSFAKKTYLNVVLTYIQHIFAKNVAGMYGFFNKYVLKLYLNMDLRIF